MWKHWTSQHRPTPGRLASCQAPAHASGCTPCTETAPAYLTSDSTLQQHTQPRAGAAPTPTARQLQHLKCSTAAQQVPTDSLARADCEGETAPQETATTGGMQEQCGRSWPASQPAPTGGCLLARSKSKYDTDTGKDSARQMAAKPRAHGRSSQAAVHSCKVDARDSHMQVLTTRLLQTQNGLGS